MKNIDGEQFMCKKHQLDYRICCEECQKKYKEFQKTLETIKKEDKEYAKFQNGSKT